jgi:diphosphomevalonate decarboxylase
MSPISAEARSNIALVKYWGKRDASLNLPAAGSLSLTLDLLVTRTTVTVDATLADDTLELDGRVAPAEATARVRAFLDLVRSRAGARARARVTSGNSFPTGSGLASSASAFAALALAATRAYGIDLPPAELSALARRGSGSAARSIFGGFVEMLPEGHAVPILAPGAWDVRLVVAVVGGGAAKDVLSRAGMERTATTSPLYAAWLASVPGDLAAARAALAARDLAALGEVAERSALTMHASALAARPAVVYWRGPTLEALHAVRALRAAGTPAWATIDAGPHVKVLTDPDHATRVQKELAAVAGVTSTIVCAPGDGARLL